MSRMRRVQELESSVKHSDHFLEQNISTKVLLFYTIDFPGAQICK